MPVKPVDLIYIHWEFFDWQIYMYVELPGCNELQNLHTAKLIHPSTEGDYEEKKRVNFPKIIFSRFSFLLLGIFEKRKRKTHL